MHTVALTRGHTVFLSLSRSTQSRTLDTHALFIASYGLWCHFNQFRTIVSGHVHVEVDCALQERSHGCQHALVAAFCVYLIVQVQCPQQIASNRRRCGDTGARLCEW